MYTQKRGHNFFLKKVFVKISTVFNLDGRRMSLLGLKCQNVQFTIARILQTLRLFLHKRLYLLLYLANVDKMLKNVELC